MPTGDATPAADAGPNAAWDPAVAAADALTTSGGGWALVVLLCVPCKGTVDPSVKVRPGQLSLRPEAQGAVQEVTNGLKHCLKRPRRRPAGHAGRNVSEH